MRWMIVCCVLLLFITEIRPVATRAANCPEKGSCGDCHQVQLTGSHAGVACADCHHEGADFRADPAAFASQADGCLGCHTKYIGILRGPMTTRLPEEKAVRDCFDQVDPHFFDNNCQNCHVGGCLDCHGADGHRIASPAGEKCGTCHRGYFVGADYFGRAPREDALRYQRGQEIDGERYLKMTPDVHAESGLDCGDCHTMASLAGNEPPRRCLACHQPDRRVIEHSIPAHLEKMECYACHSAWAPQEYGTFYLEVGDSNAGDSFPVKKGRDKGYVKSSYLKRQDAPPLGINSRGKISPIRPQFIFYYSDLRPQSGSGVQNKLLAARWRAFFPHTIRRGTVMCDGCHHNPSRFLLEPEKDRLLQPEKDGMGLSSFWRQGGQQLANGSFINLARYQAMTRKDSAYIQGYVKKWKQLIQRVENSSNR